MQVISNLAIKLPQRFEDALGAVGKLRNAVIHPIDTVSTVIQSVRVLFKSLSLGCTRSNANQVTMLNTVPARVVAQDEVVAQEELLMLTDRSVDQNDVAQEELLMMTDRSVDQNDVAPVVEQSKLSKGCSGISRIVSNLFASISALFQTIKTAVANFFHRDVAQI